MGKAKEIIKLSNQLPGVPDELLGLLYEDAEETFRRLTHRDNPSDYSGAVRAIAVLLYNRMGREGETSHGCGGVSIGYDDIPNAVKHLLPYPLASVGGRRLEHVETLPED